VAGFNRRVRKELFKQYHAGCCISNIAQGFNLGKLVMICIETIHCAPMVETIGYVFSKLCELCVLQNHPRKKLCALCGKIIAKLFPLNL
jgi:hypothetical protein